jgi:hypothetical protein
MPLAEARHITGTEARRGGHYSIFRESHRHAFMSRKQTLNRRRRIVQNGALPLRRTGIHHVSMTLRPQEAWQIGGCTNGRQKNPIHLYVSRIRKQRGITTSLPINFLSNKLQLQCMKLVLQF